jgi:hypothetical protein
LAPVTLFDSFSKSDPKETTAAGKAIGRQRQAARRIAKVLMQAFPY